jgi:hypothetical protein
MKKSRLNLVLLAVLLFCGCGQNIPYTPAPVPPAPDTTVSLTGTVYKYDYRRDTADRSTPLADIAISLSGAANLTTVSSADGTFEFSKLPPGKYQLTATGEGYQYQGRVNYSTACDLSLSSLAAVEINLDPRPVLLGADFSDNAELPASQSAFRLYFSEPVSPETVTAFIKKTGLRTMSTATTIPVTLGWENSGKTLVVTTAGPLDADALYELGVTSPSADLGVKGIKDRAQNQIYGTQPFDYSVNNSATDSYYGLYYYLPFKTLSGKTSKPAAPSGLIVTSSVTGTTEIDYTSLYSSTSGVALRFTGSSGSNGYRVYASTDGVNYRYLKESASPSVFVYVSDLVGAFGGGIACGYDSYGYPIEPGLPWPFLGSGIYLKVTAYNSLGESAASAPVLVADNVEPDINATAVSESTTVKVIKFTEPLERNSAENKANYLLVNGATYTIESVALVNDYAYGYQPYKQTYVRLTLKKADAGPRNIWVNGVKDLSGNQMTVSVEASY